MPLKAGQRLQGRYLIQAVIAQGGFATVYRAYDQVLTQLCAIKESQQHSAEADAQFEQEALMLARLRHPNLPRVIDHFRLLNQGQYLVMDFVAGQSLAQLLQQRGQPLAEAEAIELISQVADALHYLHSQEPPIIHRDVKPQNIIVTPAGQVMLVDFGISKFYRPDLPTVTAAQAYTPGYAAPEQYGYAPSDARSDIYGLGATLYTLLTDQRPPDALQRLLDHTPVTPPRQLNSTISATTEAAILHALTLAAAKRLPTVAAFQQALSSRRAQRTNRWRTMVILGIALGVILLFALGRWLWQQNARLATQPASTALAIAALRPTFTPTLLPAATPTAISPTATVLLPTATNVPEPTATLVVPTSIPPTPLGGGTLVAFTSERDGNAEIYIMNPNGSNPVNLTNHPASDQMPAWSPAGNRIAFESNRAGNWEIYAINQDGTGLEQLTNDPGNEQDAQWSPDGSRLLFHSNREDGILRVWMMNLASGALTRMTDDAAGDWHGSWSPDSQQIVYAHDATGVAEIYRVNVDGSERINLTNSQARESVPNWSPDGRQIVFYSERDGNREIYIMNADGSGQTRLTNDPAIDFLANWSPDGRFILFTSDRDGNQELYRMEVGSGGVTRLTDNPASDYYPDWSPN